VKTSFWEKERKVRSQRRGACDLRFQQPKVRVRLNFYNLKHMVM